MSNFNMVSVEACDDYYPILRWLVSSLKMTYVQFKMVNVL